MRNNELEYAELIQIFHPVNFQPGCSNIIDRAAVDIRSHHPDHEGIEQIHDFPNALGPGPLMFEE